MKLIRWAGLIVLAIVAVSAIGLAQSAPATRSVVVQLTLPNGATPQLRIADGKTGSVEITDIGKFGFVPTIDANPNLVVVDIVDMNSTPHERLDRVELVVGGDSVQSASNPQFGVRVLRVVTP